MATSIIGVEVEPVETISALDLAKLVASDAAYKCFRIVPIQSDGRRGSVLPEMIFHAAAGRAGVAWGADAHWTDATDPADAAERFFELNGKEMSN